MSSNAKLPGLSPAVLVSIWLDGSSDTNCCVERLKRLIGSATRRANVVLTLALVATLGATSHAQATLPITALQERAPRSAVTTARPLPEQLDEARAQLKQALDQRDKQTSQHQGQYRQGFVHDEQRLLDWLVDLHREKAKRIEELLVLRNLAVSPVVADPLVKALQGTPPYSAIQVDALRDEIDGLKEKLATAEASFRANQTEIQNLHDQLKARDAASRQAGGRALGASSDADVAKSGDELQNLALLRRIAEIEIGITALDQERLKLQIASWRERIEALQAIAVKVLPEQRLSTDDLAAQQQRVRADHEKLSSEIEWMARQNAQHRAEREKLDAKGRATGGTEDGLEAFLELSLKTDNAILKGLDHLQLLNSVSGDAWEKRYVLLSSADPEQRRTASAALNELGRKLADWRSQLRVRQEALRTEIRTQRIRIDNLAEDRREQGREKEFLNLLLRQAAMDERVELGAARLEKQVSRWLMDSTVPGNKSFSERVAWVCDRAAALLKRIWQQELFVTEDVSEVDGRQVSVKYGITVGKSVGLFVVFVVGYWLLARISRFIQHQLVRSLRVSHQLASVIRRWSMIGLSLALVVLLLNLARIPLSVFAFLGGTLAIGVGFGAQTIIKNFICGLIVLFERKIRIGDVVELGGVAGYVTAVDLRATTVQGFNGVDALIPNANFVENQVVNWTYSSQQVRRELTVDIAYGTNVRQAGDLFLAAAAEHANVLKDPAPEVFFDAFGDHALTVALVYWVDFDGPMGPRRVDSDLRHDIYGRLAESGIRIPFPQRDVHVNFAQPVSTLTPNLEPICAR